MWRTRATFEFRCNCWIQLLFSPSGWSSSTFQTFSIFFINFSSSTSQLLTRFHFTRLFSSRVVRLSCIGPFLLFVGGELDCAILVFKSFHFLVLDQILNCSYRKNIKLNVAWFHRWHQNYATRGTLPMIFQITFLKQSSAMETFISVFIALIFLGLSLRARGGRFFHSFESPIL